MSGAELRGFTVAVTAERRRDEQAVLLERTGAEVQIFSLLQTETDGAATLEALTGQIAASPPDFLIANTGYGMRAWFNVAETGGIRENLAHALRSRTTIAARGAKALGELRKNRLEAGFKASGETLEEVVEWLLRQDIRGKSVVVQMHGEPAADAIEPLSHAGANVTWLPVYRMAPAGQEVSGQLVRAILAGEIDAVTFTAAPQVRALYRCASAGGVDRELSAAFGPGGVIAACIGDVCAGAAIAEGISEPLVPEHPRIGSLTNGLAARLSQFRLTLAGEHGPLRLCGGLVVRGADETWLGATDRRLLRALVATGGPALVGELIDGLRGRRQGLEGLDGLEPPLVDQADKRARRLSGVLDGALQISEGYLRLAVVS